jgi:YihY family inner membrane protein
MGLGTAVGAAGMCLFERRGRPADGSARPPAPSVTDQLAGVAPTPAEGPGKDTQTQPTGTLRVLDTFQRRHAWAGFPYAVVKKFGDDEGGDLAALVAYYAFLSIFPLLLAAVTILGFLLEGNTELRDRVLHSALTQIPVIGDQLKVGALDKSGVALVIGLVGAVWGGMGVANAGQRALNQVWEVPKRSLPGFFPRVLRSVGLLVLGAVGIGSTTVLTGIGSGTGTYGVLLRVVVLAASVLVNIAFFTIAFRVLTVRDVGWKQLLPGAVVAAVAWQVLQTVGGAYMTHQLDGMSDTYGTFAVVLGLLSWLYLQARIVLYAAEINVVLAGGLWPRGLGKPLTRADRRALRSYAEVEERRVDTDVDVEFA